MGNVKAAPSQLLNEQRYRCVVCGREMAYTTPISINQQGLLMGAFIEGHAQCGQPEVGEEVPA